MIRKIIIMLLAAVSVIAASNVPMYYQFMAPTATANAYLDLVGNTANTNFVSTPPASYSPAEELDITLDIESDNWNQLNLGYASRWGGTTSSRQYEFASTTKTLRMALRTATNTTTYTATTAATLTGRHIIRVATWIDDDNRVVRFWVDGNQVGNDVTSTDVADIFTPTAARDHSIDQRYAFRGKCYRAEYRAAVGGSIVMLMDPNEYSSGDSWVSSTGETWTLNGTAKITKE